MVRDGDVRVGIEFVAWRRAEARPKGIICHLDTSIRCVLGGAMGYRERSSPHATLATHDEENEAHEGVAVIPVAERARKSRTTVSICALPTRGFARRAQPSPPLGGRMRQ